MDVNASSHCPTVTEYSKPFTCLINTVSNALPRHSYLSSLTHLLLAGSHLNPTLPLRCFVVDLQTTETDLCLLLALNGAAQ
jgi:hypothetical protein